MSSKNNEKDEEDTSSIILESKTNEIDEGLVVDIIVTNDSKSSYINDAEPVLPENFADEQKTKEEEKITFEHHDSIELIKTGDTLNKCFKNEKLDLMKKIGYLHCPFIWKTDLQTIMHDHSDLDLLTHSNEMFEKINFGLHRNNTLQVLAKIKSYDSMSEGNKAGIWAIRASVYIKYGYTGIIRAVEYMKKAISLDPNNAHWHFMKGKYLGRLRRMENVFTIPGNEEFSALKKAVHIKKDPYFIAFIAELYIEIAKGAKMSSIQKFINCDTKAKKQFHLKLNKFYEDAAKLFEKSVNLNQDCAHLLFRCGKGLMNLPPPYQNLKLAYNFLMKGLNISPESSYGNHAMTIFLEKYQMDLEQSKEYLAVAVNQHNFDADMNKIRINFLETRNSELLIEELMKMLELYTDLPKKRKLFGEIVCFYLLLENDLVEAIYYMKKLILKYTELNETIYNFRTGILPLKVPVPLLGLILSQIKFHINKNKDISKEEINICEKFIYFLCDENIKPRLVSENLLKNFTNILRETIKTLKVDENDVNEKKITDLEENMHGEYTNEEYLNYRNLPQQTDKTVGEFFNMFKEKSSQKITKKQYLENEYENDFKPNRNQKQRYDCDKFDQKDQLKCRKSNYNYYDSSDSSGKHKWYYKDYTKNKTIGNKRLNDFDQYQKYKSKSHCKAYSSSVDSSGMSEENERYHRDYRKNTTYGNREYRNNYDKFDRKDKLKCRRKSDYNYYNSSDASEKYESYHEDCTKNRTLKCRRRPKDYNKDNHKSKSKSHQTTNYDHNNSSNVSEEDERYYKDHSNTHKNQTHRHDFNKYDQYRRKKSKKNAKNTEDEISNYVKHRKSAISKKCSNPDKDDDTGNSNENLYLEIRTKKLEKISLNEENKEYISHSSYKDNEKFVKNKHNHSSYGIEDSVIDDIKKLELTSTDKDKKSTMQSVNFLHSIMSTNSVENDIKQIVNIVVDAAEANILKNQDKISDKSNEEVDDKNCCKKAE
ncbi:hypothetical protein PGB90_001502 [Kerria lacca]